MEDELLRVLKPFFWTKDGRFSKTEPTSSDSRGSGGGVEVLVQIESPCKLVRSVARRGSRPCTFVHPAKLKIPESRIIESLKVNVNRYC